MIRWPFAWRSTVESWQHLFHKTWDRQSEGFDRAYKWSQTAHDLQRHVEALTNSDHTTPEVMATIFAGWDSERQAEFFNRVGDLTSKYEMNRCFQFAYIADDLNESGSSLLEELGQYARPTKT